MTEKEEGRAQKNTLNMWCCARANSEEKTTQRQLIVCQILPIKKDKRGRSLEKNIPISLSYKKGFPRKRMLYQSYRGGEFSKKSLDVVG